MAIFGKYNCYRFKICLTPSEENKLSFTALPCVSTQIALLRNPKFLSGAVCSLELTTRRGFENRKPLIASYTCQTDHSQLWNLLQISLPTDLLFTMIYQITVLVASLYTTEVNLVKRKEHVTQDTRLKLDIAHYWGTDSSMFLIEHRLYVLP